MTSNIKGCLLTFFASILCCLVSNAAFGITPVVLEGDSVPGVGTVTAINNLAVNNSGGWLVEADTDQANTDEDVVLLKNGALFLQEGKGGLSGPPGAIIDSFDSVTLNNASNSGFNFFLDPFPPGEDSGIYLNTDLVIQEGDISTSSEFSPGTPYLGFFDVKINNHDRLMSVASVDDAAISSSVDRAIVLIDNNPLVEDVVAKEGDILPGQTEAVADFGTGPHQSAFNDSSQVLFFADLTGDTAADGAIYLNEMLLAQEGSPSPLAGRNYQTLSSRGLDVNNAGDTIFKADVDGDSATDDLLVLNGAVFKQTGESPPGIAGFALTSFGTGSGPVQLDDAGNVLWFGDWDDPNTDVDTGLFLNDTLLVQEGVTTIDGLLVDVISSGSDAFFISDNGQFIIFEATLEGSLNGAFLITIPEPRAVLLLGIALIALCHRRRLVA